MFKACLMYVLSMFDVCIAGAKVHYGSGPDIGLHFCQIILSEVYKYCF